MSKEKQEKLNELSEFLEKEINKMNNMLNKNETKDNVNPSHYKSKSGSQLKDVFNDFDLINFNINSAITYLFRAGKKDDILQELGKAKKFIEFEEERIKLIK